MNQDRLAQNAVLAACLQDRVRPVPLRKSKATSVVIGDCSVEAGSSAMNRREPAPVQFKFVSSATMPSAP